MSCTSGFKAFCTTATSLVVGVASIGALCAFTLGFGMGLGKRHPPESVGRQSVPQVMTGALGSIMNIGFLYGTFAEAAPHAALRVLMALSMMCLVVCGASLGISGRRVDLCYSESHSIPTLDSSCGWTCVEFIGAVSLAVLAIGQIFALHSKVVAKTVAKGVKLEQEMSQTPL